VREFLKRIFDIFVSLLAIVLLLPVFAVIAIAIRVSSKGPILFKQERAGRYGKPFTFYKFRTMKMDVDAFAPSPKSSDDPRLTKVGKFLREYSLDELPQLFNVLKGDMSIVGPRPLYVSQMAEWNKREKKRLLVRPGVTGLSQIKGRASLTQEDKAKLEVEYVEKQSFWLDIKIILLTFGVIFGKKGVYEKRYSEKEQTRGEKESSSNQN
jgi:lipopolysaccharide/colanic/teichoic acid biosynthesis glycosyltransferase